MPAQWLTQATQCLAAVNNNSSNSLVNVVQQQGRPKISSPRLTDAVGWCAQTAVHVEAARRCRVCQHQLHVLLLRLWPYHPLWWRGRPQCPSPRRPPCPRGRSCSGLQPVRRGRASRVQCASLQRLSTHGGGLADTKLATPAGCRR